MMVLRGWLGAACFVVLAIAGADLAAAHGSLNAGELEVQVLLDEKSDVQTSLAGYDLGDVYVGEAWRPGLGDGIYFHMLLYGTFPGTPAADEYRVRFTITLDSEEKIVRELWTTDGKAFRSDFDEFLFETTAQEVEVQRAFLRAPSLKPGAIIQSFVVESLADGELRDRAPGGLYPPGGQGRVEVPDESRQTVPSLTLSGPTKYVTANFTKVAADEYVATLQTLLKKGSQHVHLETPLWSLEDPAATGWRFEVHGESGDEVKPSQSVDVRFALSPVGDALGLVPPRMINVTTDIGGRLGFQVRSGAAGVEFVPESEIKDWAVGTPTPEAEAPGVGIVPVLLLLAVLCFVARARR